MQLNVRWRRAPASLQATTHPLGYNEDTLNRAVPKGEEGRGGGGGGGGGWFSRLLSRFSNSMCIIATLDRLEDFLHYKFENADFPATPARVLEWFRFDFPLAQKGDATTYRHVFRRRMAGPRNRRLPLVRTRADCPRRHPRINCTPC